ncbi:deoxyribodipyrimidine photolyase [Jeotgalibacillus alimentarius]|uniref:Deoxyribodipyrimidine photolyase n=1 Tax=Jeotgalibacillus alimentarius TaxID=135826 RepID=A0A0C2W4A6_9BACL|nr:FAD-dependent oxidoreductase [Jeotgalibacillus alimentarius]KIL51436.1 deoxyribodipyrimidine photolyase [Jeotgalibacillus alimentarius]
MKIGIIGGGMSGLIAARDLQAAGHTVEIIEKSRSVGGRMATRRINDGQADHGAVYFTVRSDELKEEVKEWQTAGVVQEWFVADPYPRYVGLNGMNKIGKYLAEGLDVRLNEKVETITAKEGSIVLTASEQLHYDVVILTAPIPQASELLGGSSLNLTQADQKLKEYIFEPALVGLVELNENIQVGEYGLLDQDLPDGILKIVNNEDKGISKNPILSIYMTGEWSEEWFDREDKALEEVVRLTIEQLGDLSIASKQLKRWRYAQAKQVFKAPYYKLEQHPVWLCGDAFLEPDDPSGHTRVESAYISGKRLAEHIIRFAQS